MNNLKPIKIPEFSSKGKVSKISRDIDIDRMKKDIETALSKMNTFVTKEDIESGLIERRAKTDEKLIKDDVFNEMNEIKKTILRNEDHINNLVSDMEQLKKEMGTVEKREWGKIKDMPDVEELKHRIEEVERRMKTTQSGLLLIE